MAWLIVEIYLMVIPTASCASRDQGHHVIIRCISLAWVPGYPRVARISQFNTPFLRSVFSVAVRLTFIFTSVLRQGITQNPSLPSLLAKGLGPTKSLPYESIML